MKKLTLRFVLLTFLAFWLSACFGPKTPQDVSEVFWHAVLNNDVKDAVKYSTLTDAKYYDSFSRNWSGYQPTFGRVVIEEKQASVVTNFASPANSGLEDISFTTYLVQRDGKWLVDYDSTNNSIHGGPLGDFLNKLNKLGEDISRQLESSANNFSQEMERLAEELAQAAESFGQQASKSIEKHAEQLRQNIRELRESIERALKDKDKDLSDEEKQRLQAISSQLDHEDENLSQPSAQAVSEGSRNIGKAQQQLESIDNQALAEYQKQWRELSEEFATAMREILDELSAATGEKKK